jgi:hypothetical protein
MLCHRGRRKFGRAIFIGLILTLGGFAGLSVLHKGLTVNILAGESHYQLSFADWRTQLIEVGCESENTQRPLYLCGNNILHLLPEGHFGYENKFGKRSFIKRFTGFNYRLIIPIWLPALIALMLAVVLCMRWDGGGNALSQPYPARARRP